MYLKRLYSVDNGFNEAGGFLPRKHLLLLSVL